MKENIEDLSKTIKWHRQRINLSQQQLADMASVSRASLQRLEKGHTGAEMLTLLKVMDVLNLKLELKGRLMFEYEEGLKK